MIESFRSLFAPPRHFILIVTALWIGLALAERRTQRHGISKEQLNNMTFYSLIGYMLGGRILFAVNNLSSFMGSPLSIFSPNPDLFDPTGALIIALLITIGGSCFATEWGYAIAFLFFIIMMFIRPQGLFGDRT
jgi:hypothetical protein